MAHPYSETKHMPIDMRELHDECEPVRRNVKARRYERRVMRLRIKESEHAFVCKRATAVDPEPEMDLDLSPKGLLGQQGIVVRNLRIFQQVHLLEQI